MGRRKARKRRRLLELQKKGKVVMAEKAKRGYESSSKYRFLVVNPNLSVQKMLEKAGHTVVTKGDDPFDIVLFTGGEDIAPFLYGQTFHKSTRANINRDLEEMNILRVLNYDVPKVGICRGGQLLNIFNGGSMFQNVDNHVGSHKAFEFLTGAELTVTSTHHQMMIPASHAQWLMIAETSTKRETDTRVLSSTTPHKDDVEALYYEPSRSLCFQPHPEHSEGPCQDLFFQYVDFFFEEVVHPEAVKERNKQVELAKEQLSGINQC